MTPQSLPQSPSPANPIALRLTLALLGAAAGIALWWLFESLDPLLDHDTAEARAMLAATLFASGFFGVTLIATGPLSLARAAAAAALLAGIAALLFTWASLRFDSPAAALGCTHCLAAWVFLLAIPTPFAIVALTPGTRWHDYEALFARAWEIVVRYAAALVFTGAFWAVMLLSDLVLKLAGIYVILRLIENPALTSALTGLILGLGLGLGVVHEQRARISPVLLLRLFRLLLPLVFAVSLVFVLTAGSNGFGGLPARLSVAKALMAMAAVAVTLITVSIDRNDSVAARAPVLAWSARLMSLLVPVLGALALRAIWIRVGQYGLSPVRVGALIGAGVTLAYGLGYGAAVLRGAGWRGRIRRINVALALAMVALFALALTPVLDAQRLSVRSQLARLEAGAIKPDELDLWTLKHDWGRPGREAIAALRDPAHPMAAALAPLLTRLDAAKYRRDWRETTVIWRERHNHAADYAALRRQIPVLPAGQSLPERLSDAMPRTAATLIGHVTAGCARKTPAGAPGCVALRGHFRPGPQEDTLLVWWTGHKVEMQGISADGSIYYMSQLSPVSDTVKDPAFIDEILAGGFTLAPPDFDALHIGDRAFWLR